MTAGGEANCEARADIVTRTLGLVSVDDGKRWWADGGGDVILVSKPPLIVIILPI